MEVNNVAPEVNLANKKLDEFIEVLNDSRLDDDAKKELQARFNAAVQNQNLDESFKEFRQLDDLESVNRESMVNDLEMLLSKHQLDSKASKRYIKRAMAKRVIQFAIALTLIGLGMSMIIMPAPPYFEMFTIFYFNPNDGVTIMDVISLLIVFSGVYLSINCFSKDASN